METVKTRFTAYIHQLQDTFCDALEKADGGGAFREDTWAREGGGGGRTRVITNGSVFEKGGVNVSTVFGELPDEIKTQLGTGTTAKGFYATGISLVLHPLSPMVPTVHANFRFFELYRDEKLEKPMDAWFGGGADLTPCYLWEEDAVHFHQVLKNACDKHGHDLYPRFKEACDNYFYNRHREEARGIGGLFFDYLRKSEARPLEAWEAFTVETGNRFLDAYLPIVGCRKETPYTEENRYWQEIRRGRYVEFNLIHDKGTLFGLKTDGRIESILMSLPPRVRWDYNVVPGDGTPEQRLLEYLTNPVDWIAVGEKITGPDEKE